jgi:cell division protein YceG involved in septum cleavage
MEGAAEPDGSDYFYFVAKPDGSKASAFAKTYDEHKKNVAAYVKGS